MKLVGKQVTIAGGPLKGMNGVVQSRTSARQVLVTIDFLIARGKVEIDERLLSVADATTVLSLTGSTKYN